MIVSQVFATGNGSPLVFVIQVSFMGGFAYLAHKRVLARRLALARFAKREGLIYVQSYNKGPITDPQLYPSIARARAEFHQLAQMHINEVVSGVHGTHWLAIFAATIGSGKSTRYFTCGLININVNCRDTRIQPGKLHLNPDGLQHVEFESDDFNNKFSVHSEDPRFATALIDPHMMETLMESNPFGMSINLCNNSVLFCRELNFGPGSWPSIGNLAQAFEQAVPSVVSELYPLRG